MCIFFIWIRGIIMRTVGRCDRFIKIKNVRKDGRKK
jgi:hypothetical protein